MTTTNREPINRLGNVIQQSGNSHFAVHKPKQRIDLHNQNKIFYLIKGNVSVYSQEGEVLVVNIFAPEIICLEKLSNLKIYSYMRCVTECEFSIISTQDARDLLEVHSLWSDAFDILTRYLYIYYSRDNKLTRPTTRESIIQYLKYIWAFKLHQRETTSVYTFILERTHISRSLIHKVVSELQAEGLIIVQRGILTDCKL
ncbi:TPA: helix-turn-helix domain-containing protein [Enterobacter hormaechei]